MDAGEPRVRRRGMFIHVETAELDHVEQESAEGVPVRIAPRKPTHARVGHAQLKLSPTDALSRAIRSANATGNRRLARTSR